MRVLIVDDDRCILDLLSRQLVSEGFHCETAECLAEMREKIRREHFDAVLLDIHLSDGEDGLSVIPELLRDRPSTRIFIMTGSGSIEVAVEAMQLGASSFVLKNPDPGVFVRALKKHFAGRGLYCETAAAVEDDLSEASEGGSGAFRSASSLKPADFGLVGSSAALQKVMDYVEILRDVDSRVLITGESGTGKEVVAKALHASSRRSGRRFEAINCGAIPENLLESELFGHKRGAFTDAKSDHKGFFETCSDGTLFLDEIGEMPLQLQVKLLRVLQESRVTPVGANQSIKINTRVIAATNRSLEEEVRKGRFREDLYYRLSVLKVHLPPLRERRDDIPALVLHFLKMFSDRFGKVVAAPTHEIMARLSARQWPGNIRELQNAIERGVVLSRDGRLHLEHMLEDFSDDESSDSETAMIGDFGEYLSMPLSEAKESFEKVYLGELLRLSKGNISEAARLCGRYRADIYRLMEKHGMKREDLREELEA